MDCQHSNTTPTAAAPERGFNQTGAFTVHTMRCRDCGSFVKRTTQRRDVYVSAPTK